MPWAAERTLAFTALRTFQSYLIGNDKLPYQILEDMIVYTDYVQLGE